MLKAKVLEGYSRKRFKMFNVTSALKNFAFRSIISLPALT
jgi:hypothetical protein